MTIAYFKGNLIDYLGENARSAFSIIGLSDHNIRQINSDNMMHSFIEIIGNFDTTLCTSTMTVDEANAKMSELFVPKYFISNETLFSASLNAKIASGDVNLDELDEDMTQSEQYAWFKSLGVKGIASTKAPADFTE